MRMLLCRTEPPTPDAPQPQLDAANIRAAVEGSLRRLQTTYVDLVGLPAKPGVGQAG